MVSPSPSRVPVPVSRGMSLLLVLCVVAGLLGSCLAVDVGLGQCPDKQVVQNFDAQKYMGKWFELERYWQIFEINGKCVTAEYTLDKNTGIVGVKNSQVDSTSGDHKSIVGTAVLTNPPEAKLAVTFQIPVVGNQTAPYWVLDTDYTNYAVVYSCTQFFGTIKVESAWILSRTTSPSDATTKQINDAIEKSKIRRASFQKTAQDCGST